MPKGVFTRTHSIDLSGKRFSKLIVLERDGKKGWKYTYKCKCDCGNLRNNVVSDGLTRGFTKSCGCDHPNGAMGRGLSKEKYIEHTKKRLLKNRKIVNECWEWKGFSQNKGYGFISWGQGKSKTKWLVHRISYTIWKGEIPKGMFILHSCDNPKCFNPDHLSVGTQKDNLQQMSQRGRSNARYGSKSGKSKLKESEVIKIRQMRDEGKTLKEISKKFNVTDANISDICQKYTWKHV